MEACVNIINTTFTFALDAYAKLLHPQPSEEQDGVKWRLDQEQPSTC